MTNFTTPQGNTPKDGGAAKPAGQGGYKSKLEEILAKAGNNNPIAAAQAKNLGKTAQQPQQPAQQSPQPQQAPQAPAPAAPAAPQPAAPAQPQNPNDRLQQILAMAGQTPAQRSQTQAQQAQAQQAANIQAMLQGYLQALAQDPRKILECDVEFPANPGANDTIYIKCYADASNNIYWDVFGDDISYIIPGRIANYQLLDYYYRGITDADFQADMATATVRSHRIV